MSRSRYASTGLVDGKSYSTFTLPTKYLDDGDLLKGIESFEYVFKMGDRLDTLAARFFADDKYWWVIALVNNISYPFPSGGLVPGRKLRIPNSVNDVLDRILR